MSSTDPVPLQVQKGIYMHSKTGNLYEVLGVALHTETNEQMVIYRPLDTHSFEMFARPHSMFIDRVMIDGVEVERFQRHEQ